MTVRVNIPWHALQTEINEAAIKGMLVAAEVVLTEAKRRVPQDTGTLRRSHSINIDNLPNSSLLYQRAKSTDVYNRVNIANISNRLGHVKIYVSANTPYAHRQHEELNYNHQIGEAKWLEKALLAKQQQIPRIIAGEIRRYFR